MTHLTTGIARLVPGRLGSRRGNRRSPSDIRRRHPTAPSDDHFDAHSDDTPVDIGGRDGDRLFGSIVHDPKARVRSGLGNPSRLQPWADEYPCTAPS
jgi:hypothetical protein